MRNLAVSQDFDLAVYNALPPVEDADRSVRRDDRLEQFLEASARVFTRHNMQRRFGVALLHRHNECAAGEHMIEYQEVYQGSDVLVTRPMHRQPAQDAAVPVVWSLSGTIFSPLEFTTDAAAAGLLHEGEIPDGFLRDFAALTEASPIGKLLGLAVVARDFYRAARPDEIALEYANLIDRSNVVFLSDRAEAAGKTIETAWSFNVVPLDAKHCTDTRECLKTCHKTDNQGGHTGQTTHRPNPPDGHVQT